MSAYNSLVDRDLVERWFVRRGVPQAIDDYNASDDVNTRMVPYLAFVFVFGAMSVFGDEFSGWKQFGVLLAALGILLAVAAGINKLRGRRLAALPDTIGVLEIVGFLISAPLLALLFSDDRGLPLQLFVLNLALFAIGYGVTRLGLFPMIKWGMKEVVIQLRGLVTLFARTLPLLLLFATFLFLNAEMWQVAHDLTPVFYAIVIALIVGPALLFLVLRSPGEVNNMHQFASWPEIDEICAGTDAPIGVREGPCAEGVPQLLDLDRGEQRNLSLLMIIAQLVQIALVALVIGGFYVLFGMFTVRRETILQWTEIDAADFEPLIQFNLFGDEVVITWELIAVSGFIAAISALQFAVSLVTDDLYREQFYESLEREIRQVLAVRARYLEPMVQMLPE